LPTVNCSQTIYNDNDVNEWNKIPIYQKYFKCARLNSSQCDTYVVKATYRNREVKVKVDVGCKNEINPLSKIVISLDPNANYQNAGICGKILYYYYL
jgi:hypothetical protein